MDKLAFVLRIIIFCLELFAAKLVVDPFPENGDINVDGGVGITAADAPCHDTRLIVLALGSMDEANERRAAVAGARILTLLAACADEALIENKEATEPCFAQPALAFVALYDRQLDALQDGLVDSLLAKLVLSPTSGEASLTVQAKVGRWQASSVHILGQYYW